MRTKPVRLKRRHRTLAQEFRDSFRAGPRVWCVAAGVLGYVASRFSGPWLLVGLLLLLLPSLFGAAFGRLVAAFRDARTLRRLQRTPPGLRRLRRTQRAAL